MDTFCNLNVENNPPDMTESEKKIDLFENNIIKIPKREQSDHFVSEVDLKNVCMGCLESKHVSNMEEINSNGVTALQMFEEVTKTKINAPCMLPKMCQSCFHTLIQTRNFLKSLQHNYLTIEKLATQLKFAQKEEDKDDTAIETLTEHEIEENLCQSDASDDDIPLSERFGIDVNKLKENLQTSSCEDSKTPTPKRIKKSKTSPGNTSKCMFCKKEVIKLLHHLQSVHLVDWTRLQCLICSYENADEETLVKHCKQCIKSDEKVSSEEYFIDDWEELSRVYDPDNEGEEDDLEEGETKPKKRGRRPKVSRNKGDKFVCNKCDSVAFKTYGEIELHLKEEHLKESQESETACILCEKEFSNTFSLLYHMMVKHGKLKCCRLCLVSFNDSEGLLQHYKSEEHNTKCTVCGEQFRNRKALYEHRRKKHLNPQLENQKYKCPQCPKEFANPNNIRRHIMVAHNDMRFLCDTCGQSYTTKRNLQLHIQKFHEGVKVETKNSKKNFFCETCGRELKIFHKYAIAMHRAKHKGHHHVCKKCYDSFESKESFDKHVQESGHQLYECEKCQAQFVREENLKIHLKNHEAPGWNKNLFATWGKSAKLRNAKGEFECSYCPKVFKDKQRLDNHVRVHTNERPYKCQYCGKGFKTWIHRKTHVNIHLGIKKWVCRFCSKAFTNSCTLKGHEMIHTGERPNMCPECKKGFITVSAMRKHRMVHFKGANGTNDERKTSLAVKDAKMDTEQETEFLYKYGQIYPNNEVSYGSFTEPGKEQTVELATLEKGIHC